MSFQTGRARADFPGEAVFASFNGKYTIYQDRPEPESLMPMTEERKQIILDKMQRNGTVKGRKPSTRGTK